MTHGIEALAGVVAAGEPEIGQRPERLVANRPHPFDDAPGVRLGVLQGPVQVVDDRQPPPCGLGPLPVPYPPGLRGEALALVIRLCQAAPPLIVEQLDSGPQVRDRRGGVLSGLARGFRARVAIVW